MAGTALAQIPSREYIRLGGRVIAIESPVIKVLVTPSGVSLSAGQSRQFAAAVTGTTNQNVAWSLSPPVGSINTSGLYVAPATLPSPQTVTVKATSAADPTVFGVATVSLGSTFSCWQGTGIGSTDPRNSYSQVNDVFTVNGVGELGSSTDSFAFVSCPLAGDGTIVARVASYANGGWYPTAGVMMRTSRSPSADFALVGMGQSTAGPRAVFGYRGTGILEYGYAPYWVKLVRVSGIISGFISPNGFDWMKLGPDRSMPGPIEAGLMVTSGPYVPAGGFTTGVFDNVVLSDVPDFHLTNWPLNWSSGTAGDLISYGVGTSGINGLTGTVGFSLAGLPNGASAVFNPATAGIGGVTTLTVSVPRGTPAGSYSFTVTAVAGGATRRSTGTLTVTNGAPVALPPGWTSWSVGTTNPVSTASYANGTFTLTAPAGGIWNRADVAQFVAKPLPGDGSITARVIGGGESGVYPNPKAGVMMRLGPTPTSPHAFAALVGGSGVYDKNLLTYASLVTRSTNGDLTQSASAIAAKPPYWVRLQRTSGVIRGYTSKNGADWDPMPQPPDAPVTVSLSGTIYAGLAASANGGVITAQFDNVTVVDASGGGPDFTLGAPADTLEAIAGENLNIPASVVTTGSFNSPVSFSAFGYPAGASASFSPPELTGDGVSTLVLNTSPGTAEGPYTVTVAGSGGGLVRQSAANLMVYAATTQPPTADQVTPNTSTQTTQNFSFTFSDPVSASNLSWAEILIGKSLDGTGACYLHFDALTNRIYIRDDQAPLWSASLPLETTGTIGNSQCSVDAAQSSSVFSGSGLTLNLALTSKSTAAGPNSIFAIADNGVLNSGWQQLQPGSWDPPPAASLPGGWSWTSLGGDPANNAIYRDGTFTVTGYGSSPDSAGGFAYGQLSGDGTLVARVKGVAASSIFYFPNIGLMMRGGPTQSSPFAYLYLGNSNPFGGYFGTLAYAYRATVTGDPAGQTVGAAGLPRWLKLVRAGGQITGYASIDGKTWNFAAGPSPLTGTVSAGLYSSSSVYVSNFPSALDTFFDNVTLTSSADAYPTVSETTASVRLKAGGGSYTDSAGMVWSADGAMTTASAYGGGTGAGSSDPGLYAGGRVSSAGPLVYTIPAANGTYRVTLKFSDPYATAAGQRVFNVSANGATVDSGVDVFARGGGANQAYDLQFTTAATGGSISIALTPTLGTAIVSAIEIMPTLRTFSVTMNPLYSYSGTADLSVTGLPAGAAAAFSPGTVGGSGVATLTIDTTAAGAPGMHPGLVSAKTSSATHLSAIDIGIPGTAKAAAPVFTPAPGVYGSTQNVAITSTTPGATIRYTVDGTTPSPTAGKFYWKPFDIAATTTLKAVAYYGTGPTASPVTSGTYTINTAVAPVFNPPAGIYSAPITVSLTSSTPSAQIFYTTNGAIPTSATGIPFAGTPIAVSATTTLRAIAYTPSLGESDVAMAAYTLAAAAAKPSFSPTGGVYPAGTGVTITSTTPSAIILYTLDGTTPTPVNGTVYKPGTPVTIATTSILKAIAWTGTLAASALETQVYTVGSGPSWYNPAWLYRKAITIDGSKVQGSAPLSNFPVLYSVTDPSLRTQPNGGRVSTARAWDLVFTTGDGSTKLDHEIESYDPVTGNLVAWVRVPSLAAGSNTGLYLYYGNAAATDQSNKAGVWEPGYRGVYYLNLNAVTGGLSPADSTSLNPPSGATAVTGAGRIDRGGLFNGSYVALPNIVATAALTLEAWIKPAAFNNVARIICKAYSSNVAPWVNYCLRLDTPGPTGHVTMEVVTAGGVVKGVTSTAAMAANNWHHVVGTYDGASVRIFVNGAEAATATAASGAIDTVAQSTMIGYNNVAPGAGQNFSGTIDEARISTVARTPEWIATEYANENAPGTFQSTGAEETTAAPSIPPAPGGLTATAGTGSASLTWAASTGATSYKVKRGTAAGGPYPTVVATGVTGTSYNDAGLNNGTTYYYVATAVNVSGESGPSAEAAAIPMAAPVGVAAAGGNGQVTLTWGPAAPGATSYRILRRSGTGALTSVATGILPLTYTDAGLTNGTQYFYAVRAVNATGESADSVEVSATPVAPPVPPTGLTATAGTARVDLSWNVAAGAVSYKVKRGTASGGPFSDVAAGVTAPVYADSGLTNGAPYYYVVTAVNGAGESGASAVAAATPMAAPTGVAAAPGNAQATLTWATPVTGATSYRILRRSGTGGLAPIVAGLAGPPYVNTGLANGTQYFYVVRAVNATGESVDSVEVNATPVAPPAAPAGLTATGGTGQVSLSWTASAGAASYNVKRTAPVPVTVVATGVTGTSYTATGLTNGTTYTYVAAAVNAGGTSADSAAASATPFQATATTPGTKRVNLTWNAVAGTSSYQVWRATGGGAFALVNTGTSTSFNNTGLTTGQAYSYYVKAMNAGGVAISTSATVTATPN